MMSFACYYIIGPIWILSPSSFHLMGTERVDCYSYLYDLDYPESKRTPDFTLDGFHASNVARFINHRY